MIETLIKKARLKMFTNDLFFFGMMANKFTWKIEKLQKDVEGYVRFNIDDPSKIENGTIYINEDYVLKPDYNYDNLIFIVCHELLHILNKHGIRRSDRDWNVWNVACDHVIEVYLKKMSGIIKPYGDKYNIIEDLYNNNYSGCTAEYAYDWIMNHPNINIKPTGDMTVDVTDKNHTFTVVTNLGGCTSAMDSEENIKAVLTDQIIAEARAILENIKTRTKGNLPGHLSRLSKILEIQIPWEVLVEKSIKTNIIMKPDERSWKCLNKFYIPHGINLPGYTLVEDTEGTGVLIICADSSGSISDKDMKKFSSVIKNSMVYFKTIKLLVHDIAVHQRKEFTKDNIEDFYNFINKIGYKGGGGTSHYDVFKEIQTEYWEKDKDNLSMVICLTDMCSDIESCYKKWEWINNNLPLTFIITPRGNLLNLEYKHITQIKMN